MNWQVLRRSHATWLKMAGADVKDAQAQMRHSGGDYDAVEIYQQFVPESQRRVVNKLNELTGTELEELSCSETCSITVPANERRNVRKLVTSFEDSMTSERLRPALKRLASAVQLRPWPPHS